MRIMRRAAQRDRDACRPTPSASEAALHAADSFRRSSLISADERQNCRSRRYGRQCRPAADSLRGSANRHRPRCGDRSEPLNRRHQSLDTMLAKARDATFTCPFHSSNRSQVSTSFGRRTRNFESRRAFGSRRAPAGAFAAMPPCPSPFPPGSGRWNPSARPSGKCAFKIGFRAHGFPRPFPPNRSAVSSSSASMARPTCWIAVEQVGFGHALREASCSEASEHGSRLALGSHHLEPQRHRSVCHGEEK